MPESNLVGKTIANRYLVERLLARGGMASVFLAEDLRLERKVALKIIHAHLAEDSSFRNKFIREAKIAASLTNPNLVNVFDQGEDAKLIFLAMEYVPGITLRDAIKKFGALEPKKAIELFEPILDGLAAAHNAGILHRDLKPENVFLADDGRVKLGDFGLARSISANTQTGSLIGTVAYLSPELVTRGTADARSDVYAAGIMLFELLTGKQPYVGEQAVQVAYQHANDQVPAPSSFNPEVPELMDEIVLWATAREPNHRPANAAALLAVIKQAKMDIKTGTSNATAILHETMRINALQPDSLETELLSELTANLDDEHSGDETQRLEPLPAESEEWSLHPLERLQRERKSRGWAIFATSVASIVLAIAAGWWFGSGPGGFATVPNLVNRTLTDAKQSTLALGANLATESEYSTKVANGLIVRTNPSAGSLFFKGSNLTVVISKGPKLLGLPALSGLGLDAAGALLAKSGFKVGTINYWFNEAAKGTVFNYLGSDGAKVAAESPISLQVSLGPLPSVVGTSQASAISVIQAAGLQVDNVTQEFSETVAKGQTLRIIPLQDPLPKNGKVTLVVSKGSSLFAMPLVIGETLSAAQKLLSDLGLSVSINTDQLKANYGLVKVRTVSIPAGTKVRVGDSVIISNLK